MEDTRFDKVLEKTLPKTILAKIASGFKGNRQNNKNYKRIRMIYYTQKAIKRGLIPCGSEIGKQYGLTRERFTENSYLWRYLFPKKKGMDMLEIS